MLEIVKISNDDGKSKEWQEIKNRACNMVEQNKHDWKAFKRQRYVWRVIVGFSTMSLGRMTMTKVTKNVEKV